MSDKYQSISKENSEISKIILESFYKYNREKNQKNNNLEIKELFNKKDSNDVIEENFITEIAIIENKEKSFIQKLFDKIKCLFRRK